MGNMWLSIARLAGTDAWRCLSLTATEINTQRHTIGLLAQFSQSAKHGLQAAVHLGPDETGCVTPEVKGHLLALACARTARWRPRPKQGLHGPCRP